MNNQTFKDFCDEVNMVIDPLVEKVRDGNKFFMETFLYHYVLGVFIGNNKGKLVLMYFFFPLFITMTFLSRGTILWWGIFALNIVIIIDLSLERWKGFKLFLSEYYEQDVLRELFIENSSTTITTHDEEIADDGFMLNAITYHHDQLTLAEYEKVFIAKGKDALSIDDLTLVLLRMRLYEINLGSLEKISNSLEKTIKPSFLKDISFFIQIPFG